MFVLSILKLSRNAIELQTVSLSIILDLRADSLFLRIVELSKHINRPLGELFNTLEDYGVISGSVLYVQIHPWSER